MDLYIHIGSGAPLRSRAVLGGEPRTWPDCSGELLVEHLRSSGVLNFLEGSKKLFGLLHSGELCSGTSTVEGCTRLVSGELTV